MLCCCFEFISFEQFLFVIIVVMVVRAFLLLQNEKETENYLQTNISVRPKEISHDMFFQLYKTRLEFV